MAEYKFILSDGTQTHIAIPIWKSDMAKEYTYEEGHRFMRARLSDVLVFLADDYEWIMSKPFGTKIFVTVQVDWQGSGTFVDYWQGSFHQTDCTVNIDDRSIKVKPNVEDRYNKVLAGLQKEYDLMKLSPACTPVDVVRRPLLQIYTPTEDVVSCFLGGMAWEQDVVSDDYTESQLENDLHFGRIGNFVQLMLSVRPADMADGFFGQWDHGMAVGEWPDFSNSDGLYYVTYFQAYEWDGNYHKYTNGLRAYEVGGDTVLWEFKQTVSQQYERTFYPAIPSPFTMTSKREGFNDIQGTWTNTPIFARLLLGREFENSYKIPSGDLVANNRNYRYCYPYIGQNIRVTTRSSASATKWGIRPDGRYYEKPQLSYDEMFLIRALYPVARTTWGMASFWLEWDESLAYTEEQLWTQTRIRDAYTLEAVISVLLKEIDPTVTFEGTEAYSRFLYGTNPLMDGFGRLVMTPKSNVLVAEYTQPAQKAKVTLGEVLDMLEKLLGCYWFIDEQKRMRIEHVSYFKNGMSYSGTPSVGVNVVNMFNSRNGKPWTYGTGQYQYDKMDMPERYEYDWMDNVTDPFKGDPIKVRSTFVQEGNIEDVSIAKFNGDVDYMMLNPSDVSEDGFALFCCQVSGGNYSVPFRDMERGGNLLTVQNYQLAMVVVQPAFLISDMPAWDINVNDEDMTAKGIQRQKKQQISVPVGDTDGTMTQLVRTTVGDGEVERMQVSLTSRMAKYQLRFDTVASDSPVPPQPTDLFDDLFDAFAQVVDRNMAGSLPTDGYTRMYLRDMYDYAATNAAQFYDAELFALVLPQDLNLINDPDRAEKAQMAWLMAMCLVEICPSIQDLLFNVGYTAVGGSDTQKVFGYKMDSDANIARLVASVVYSMHRPAAASLEAYARQEIAAQDTGNVLGTTRGTTIPTGSSSVIPVVTDATKFMPPTPVNSNVNQDFYFDERTFFRCVAQYTYSGGAYSNARAQQAVEDSSRTTVAAQKQMYIDAGVTVSSAQEALITPAYKWGSYVTMPLKDGYDSITQTYYQGSGDTPRSDIEFRMRPFEFHGAHLLDPNDDGSGYVNTSSYPSGHAGFGWNIALMLIEAHRGSLSDVKKIITRAFQFGQSRTIGRYHWQADVIHGCVVSTCCLPRLHGYTQYLTLLSQA